MIEVIKTDLQEDGLRGEWSNIWVYPNEAGLRFKCSECEKLSDGRHKFCPNCGADMRGESDG